MGGRLVVHYQISRVAVERLGKIMDRVLEGGRGVKVEGGSKVAKVLERKADEVMAPCVE